MTEIKVTGCAICPFVEYGNSDDDYCNHPLFPKGIHDLIKLPVKTVHKLCPLKSGSVLVKLDEETVKNILP